MVGWRLAKDEDVVALLGLGAGVRNGSAVAVVAGGKEKMLFICFIQKYLVILQFEKRTRKIDGNE